MHTQEKLAIVGAGTMGHSIALSAAWAGHVVDVWGNDQADIERAYQNVIEKLHVLRQYDAMTFDDEQKILNNIRFTCSKVDVLRGATFVIEAIPENLGLKQAFFQELDDVCSDDVILASNTSGLSPTQIAAHTRHPERTVVTHFWNPGHLIPLVEVVRGEQTADATVERALQLLKGMNKKPIVVNKDILGSVGNRLQYALFREAQYIYAQGVASIEDIDAAVQYSLGRRLPVTGPFLTADMGGLDVFDSISGYLFPDLSTAQDSFGTMKELVGNQSFGQKTGSGFYEWTPEFSRRMNQERERELINWLKRDMQTDNQTGAKQ